MRAGLCGLILAAIASPALAATAFFGPLPYTSTADIPVGLYGGGLPAGLEDFEDGSLDFGITATGSAAVGVFGPGAFTDSVDADDGFVDGFGTAGRSFTVQLPAQDGDPSVLMFTFPVPVVAAALVWTDGSPLTSTLFEAFGPGMVPLGGIGPVAIADGAQEGQTGEDRLFGVADPAGVLAIRITNLTSTFIPPDTLEVDHVQFGAPVPLPPAAALLAVPVVALSRRRRPID